MPTIIVGFSHRPKNIISSAIGFFTNSKISHTYVRLPVPEYNTSVVFQAAGSNVHYMNIDHFKIKNEILYEFQVEVTPEQFIAAEKFRVFECGKPYGAMELVGFMAIVIASKFGLKIKNPFNDGTRSYVCSSVVCRQIGLPDDATISPQDLYQILKNRTDCTKIS